MPKRKQRRLGTLLLRGAIFLVVAFFVLSAIAAWQFVCPRSWDVGDRVALNEIVPENVVIKTADDVTLSGWFYPNLDSEWGAVLLHGVRADRRNSLDRAGMLSEMGFNVLVYDARGGGESGGDMISFGWYEQADVLAAVDWLQSRGIPEVICVGQSQGAATILLAAEGLNERGVKAVVAEASFATLRDAVENRFRRWTGAPSSVFGAITIPVAESLLSLDLDDVSPLERAGLLQCPVMLISGEVDGEVRPDESQALFDAVTAAKTWWEVPGAGHADFIWVDRAGYVQRVGDFVRGVMSAQP